MNELALFTLLANIQTGFVFTAVSLYADSYTFDVMVLFSSDGLCLDNHERTPNDVYWHGKGKIHSGGAIKSAGFLLCFGSDVSWVTNRESEKLLCRASLDEAEEFSANR